ncbi:MAG TPA: hypothetical protein VNI77_06225 [Nitrososphaera sp.]|nr:hypothetical protein [Nitrososphaera sp.]
MMQQGDLVKKGQFYFIYDRSPNLVLEDKTKRGLEVRERVVDEKYGVEVDRGVIHDIDGIGHKVGIRWYFPRAKYTVDDVIKIGEELEARYKAIRDVTCPDDY